jgi:hypothetical protein
VCHCVGIFQYEALEIIEVGTRSISLQVADLFRGNSVLSADGRADINSKWTAYKRCNSKFRKAF